MADAARLVHIQSWAVPCPDGGTWRFMDRDHRHKRIGPTTRG